MSGFKRKELQDRFDEIYALYPKKMGKSQGMRSASAQIKTMKDMDQLHLAVMNYTAHVIREETEKQYILYFSTFMHQWKDWLEPDIGSVMTVKVNLDGLGFKK